MDVLRFCARRKLQ